MVRCITCHREEQAKVPGEVEPADVNKSFKFVEATDAVKIMIESKAVRSTAAVPYAEKTRDGQRTVIV